MITAEIQASREVNLGNAFHSIMEFSMELDEIDTDFVRSTISNFPLNFSDTKLIINSVEKIKNSDACMGVLKKNSDIILVEREWFNSDGKIVRPDRVDFYLNSKIVRIIDFKLTSTKENFENHRNQLLKYEECIKYNYPSMSMESLIITNEAQISYIK